MASDGINLTNQFLIAMPGMVDDRFAGTVVYLCDHNDQGALGLVINRPLELTMHQLFDKIELPLQRTALADQPVFYGGPVQSERGFVLHEALADQQAPYAATLNVPDGLAMTTSKDVLEAVAAGAGPDKVLVALGYSGWGAGQLEDEISRNGWLTVAAEPAVVFDTPVAQRYERALALLGIDPRMLSQEAGHA